MRAGHEVSILRDPASRHGRLTDTDAVWPARLRRITRAALNHWGCTGAAATAELLTTELVTNAFQHGAGPEVGFRISLREKHLVIEVRDGSPLLPQLRPAGPDEENGRGLWLVEELAESWGVSDDGTTTWCTIPLTEGPPDMDPAALTSPVLRVMPLSLPADRSAVTSACIAARTRLTVLNWPGDVHDAVDVLRCLVSNAVEHGLTPGVPGQVLRGRLSITERNELLIDVTDSNPKFPNFEAAVSGEEGRGLWRAQQHGARLSWFVEPDFEGKTVRATMGPGRGSL